MNLHSLLFITITAATLSVVVVADPIGHDKVQPFAQPEPTTISEKAAVKFKPSLHIKKACHPYPAVNAAGETSGGLKGSGERDGDCKESPLGSQVYGRAVWFKDLWAIMYAWYFPKVVYYGVWSKNGHRHNWASAVVWLDNPAVETPKILAVSASKPNGRYRFLKNGPQVCDRWSCTPLFTDVINGSSVMLAYEEDYDGDGNSVTLNTDRSKGEFQDLIMWEQMTDEARNALSQTNFGEKAKVPFIDVNFNASLEAARLFR
ncbi:necrosis inducing-like protein NPP1 type [Phytophthora cinnamomi]|uniref:necrosis inducing-like protein NPP1 type n=1 Tax=Phytophthora cinnamomi TaxID=4785 RepID=UPI00355A4521|nr:necrosis inducing-like protein NPP1 type [Phytophthora cinnamomi]